jgi:hypothetical protein
LHIEFYIKAQDPLNFAEAIEIANRMGRHNELVKYLLEMPARPYGNPRSTLSTPRWIGLIQLDERRGHLEVILGLLEVGLSLERAHIGIFIELSILLSKYKPVRCGSTFSISSALRY